MATLTHIRLLTTDFTATFKFYHEVMALEHHEGASEGPYAEFKAGNVILALFPRDLMAGVVGTGDKPAQSDGQDMICAIFDVDNVDAVFERMREAGAHVVTMPEDRPGWGIRTAHFRDPSGNLIEITQELSTS